MGHEYKERDFLEGIFKFWRKSQPEAYNAKKCWELRMRQHLGTRYDARINVFDWDYSMNLIERGGLGLLVAMTKFMSKRSPSELFLPTPPSLFYPVDDSEQDLADPDVGWDDPTQLILMLLDDPTQLILMLLDDPTQLILMLLDDPTQLILMLLDDPIQLILMLLDDPTQLILMLEGTTPPS
ncbi:hypothetical protein ACOMHN_052207 [Nucella lapillus]